MSKALHMNHELRLKTTVEKMTIALQESNELIPSGTPFTNTD